MSKLAYRPEIDGLRALAVLVVLFFHANLGFSGGYVGVDVFFVISGFLITGLILKDLQAGEFRLVDFWERRIRRITPALTVMVLLTLAAGAIFLFPQDYIDLAKSALAQPVMAANFHFRDRATDYFDGPASLKPLLHTWSLAVEEQFYLILPLLLIACKGLGRKWLACLLSAIALASFALSVWGTYAFSGTTFYLLPTRAWELLTGSLLAIAVPNLTLPPVMRSVLSWSGLSGILLASLWYDSQTLFPGLNALLPCLAAAGFIAGNTAGLTSSGRVMASWPLVQIGRMSYSLYLWHWPVLAFLRYLYGVDLSLPLSLLAVGLSLALAWLSLTFVETPLRRPALLSRRRVFGLATAVSVCILCVSWGVIKGSGLRGRFSPEILQVLNSGDMANQFLSDKIRPIGRPCAPGERGTFLLWGDSHAQAIHELVHELAVKNGVSGYLACRSGVVPVPGVWAVCKGRPFPEWQSHVVDFIKARKITHVIIASRWNVTIHGGPDGSMKSMLVDEQSFDSTPETSARVLSRGLERLVSELHASGTSVWLMQQVPQQVTHEAPLLLARNLLYRNDADPPRVSLAEHQEYQSQTNAIFHGLPAAHVRLLDPTPHCFDENGYARLWQGSRCFYRDGDHLSRCGAQDLLTPLLDPVMKEISNSSNVARGAPAPVLLQTGQVELREAATR